jgi:hypothetical protein
MNNEHTPQYLPPTDGTAIMADMEERKEHLNKKLWKEIIHSSAPDTDWRAIERANTLNNYHTNYNQQNNNKSGVVDIDNGTLIAEWAERGSRNQAGSIMETSYDSIVKKLYAIADGGSIWKGGIDGLSWELLIDDLRFDKRFLEVVHTESNETRVLASIAGIPYYYETLSGWRKADGFSDVTELINKNQIVINNGRDIFFIADPGSGRNLRLYYSSDYGKSYVVSEEFNTNNIDNVAIHGHKYNRDFYLIEQISSARSRIFQWNSNINQLTLRNVSSAISFGQTGKANIELVKRNGQNWIYVIDADRRLMLSKNNGISWEFLHRFDVDPWDGGLFVSRKNPNVMMMCEVHAHISTNGGNTWRIFNHWSEYYSNLSAKFHADIMHIEEYETGTQSVITVSNHGGISTSYDQGQNFGNIGMINLNVSQYYSVKAYPNDERYIFAGSQDQGIQRTLEFEDGTLFFEQMYIGDFGHLTFTNQGKSLWTVYPGGTVSYYENPTSNNEPDHEYTIKSQQESVWLPPIIADPSEPNGILLAGGNIQENQTGSYIIKLSVSDFGFFQIDQLDHNFGNFGGEVSAMAVNPLDHTQIYVSTTNGMFFKSKNGGKTFDLKMTGLGEAHYLYGHKILCSESDPNRIIISGSGYDNSPVFISEDNGDSFRPMRNGLPSTTVFDMDYSSGEELIYAATEAGPYVYIKKKNEWHNLSQGEAPNQSYWSVEVLENQNKVRFGTFGRGIWDFNISVSTSSKVEIQTSDITIYPNPSSDYININSENKSSNYQVIDSGGKVVIRGRHNVNQNTKIDLRPYDNGLYYIIFDDGKSISSQVLIKI